MTSHIKTIVTTALVLFLIALGATDYLLSGRLQADLTGSTGVQKQSGPNIEQTATSLGFTIVDAQGQNFLSQVMMQGETATTLALLKDNDRAGTITWIESGNVKRTFIALKEALLTAFSSNLQDLRDETVVEPNAPAVNVLTFLDPALSTERLMFIRVRERLYEFHIPQGKEEAMQPLIDALTK